ncbi:UDP-N-acetylglucosamine--N-acetylmuramyl-(pentapeptide) pyrophosphoryl-undecaprenol N-acetylglucosamine transferase [Desertimonas flava]|uniref:UDP-N-acetylglucosamine--N-acetylmuramyl- (pentapeptide) pyrophosphoryl-undecaprenol N-acetylglucosamine transferase n=1 Tax=Desertimonas flava TaxID=2064846 RepID=UPI000E34F234|nr:UDP-N-acetylglucosamine--N-acetylmuramyl-(pentapeptide) pyrophosphoryl-undecaprenol N-acetylglucosamine transferase [Desertimonas flava]
MSFAVITGGGSAGHVLPALAVAEALEDAGHEAGDIHYVGARRGIESRLLPETPYGHTLLDVDGLQRGISASDLRRNAAFLPKLASAVRQARRLLRELQPKVVISVGGYASLPAVLAARRQRIPVVVVTYDRQPGQSSAITARFAAAVAAAYEGSPLPRATVTGAPVRRVIRQVDRVGGRAAAREELGLPADRFVVAVIGGSLGSGILNEAVTAYVDGHGDDRSLAVRHVVGERFAASAAAPRDGTDGVLYQVVGYEPRMDLVYAAADLLIGRGGATTVAEVSVTGIPAILVPWAGAAEDHQTGNVRWLSDADAAVLLAEPDVARLGEEIEALRHDDERRHSLGTAAAAMGAQHRGGGLAELIERVASA